MPGVLDAPVNNATCNRSCAHLPGHLTHQHSRLGACTARGRHASLVEHHHLMFPKRNIYLSWRRCRLFLGKINSVLRCYQKRSHALHSAMFIEPVKKAPSVCGRKGRELGERGSLKTCVRMHPGTGCELENIVVSQGLGFWGHGLLEVALHCLFRSADILALLSE